MPPQGKKCESGGKYKAILSKHELTKGKGRLLKNIVF
jgi:hypothetical protein